MDIDKLDKSFISSHLETFIDPLLLKERAQARFVKQVPCGRNVRISQVILDKEPDKIEIFDWPDAKIKSLAGVSEENSSSSTKKCASLGSSALAIGE